MSLKNPIKFLDAYVKEDKDIFFGRDKETSVLYEKVGQSKVVLLYGLSGTGKTSLINCGLENRFETDQRIFIYVRRGANILKSFRQAVDAAADSLIHPDAPLAEALETLYYDYLKSIIIVFDQFEELFISGDFDEKQDFIKMVAGILNSNLKVKVIFSLREEYLAYMDDFEEKIPIIFDHRHRLEKMRRVTLDEVISKIAKEGDIELENNAIPGMIIDNISDRKGNVELPYLQVYLDKLTRLMNKSGKKKVFTKLLVEEAGELEDVLGDFLEEQIDSIASGAGNKEIINNILKQLITPDGTKKQLVFSEIKPFGNITTSQLKEILTKLEQSRIIKLDDDFYELSHDSLAKNIAGKRTKEEIELIERIKFLKNASNDFRQTDTLLNRKQLKYVQPYLLKIDLSRDEKNLLDISQNRLKKIRLLKLALFFILFFALLILVYVIQNKNYQKVKRDADSFMEEGKWAEAKVEYDKALQGYIFVNKKVSRDSIKRCENLIGQETNYRKWVNSGDSLFDLGVSNYKNAFQQYNLAKNTGFAPKEITEKIKNKTDAAVAKYKDLAMDEYVAGHIDLAFVLLTEAYLLESRKELTDLIDDWLENVKPEKLDSAIGLLKSDVTLDNEVRKTFEILIDKKLNETP